MINKSLVALLALLLITSACSDKSKDNNSAQKIKPVKYITVSSSSLNGNTSFTGLAKAQKEARLSFKVSGTVDAVNIKVGQRVKKGQTLAVLDAADYQVNYNASLAGVENAKAQIENAQAQLQQAKASMIAAESNYKRFEKLYETNSISISDFEQAKSAYQSAEANYNAVNTQITAAKSALRSSESQTKSASNQVSYTRLVAPFSGIITEINVEPNEIAPQGQPVIVINSEGNPNIEIGIPESSISAIQPQQKVTVRFNTLQEVELKGIVDEIGYSPTGSTYPVTIRLIENDARIRPGMPASASFDAVKKEDKKPAIIVPASAVGEDNEGRYVYVLQNENNQLTCKRQAVKVGKVQDVNFEILDGLKGGEKIVSAGLNMLQEGMLVSLYQTK